jgi:hypothetical protein
MPTEEMLRKLDGEQGANDREMTPEEKKDRRILYSKELRIALNLCLQRLRELTRVKEWSSRERSLAITKVEEAIMWLGMDLKAANDGVSCYPDGYKANTVVNPVPDRVL